jgi:glutathione S-transferase
MKIHGHPLSSCTRKALILLAEKNARADLVTVDLFAHEQKRPEHLARHPFGVVPVLDDDGFVLYESRAILRYLDATLPGASFTPSSVRDRARMDQFLSVDQSYIAPHTRTLALERIVRVRGGEEPNADACTAAESALDRAFEVIDGVLSRSELLAGDAMSLADISLAPYVASLPMIGADHLLSRRTHLRGWFDRMSARASCRSVLTSRG